MADELSSRLLATFIQELDEQVMVMNESLIALERQGPEDEVVRALFRAAHTIKGAARVAGVHDVENVCHALESMFADVRSGALTLEGGDFALLFAAADALADSARRLRQGEAVDRESLDALLARLSPLGSAGHHPSFDVLREDRHAAPESAPEDAAAAPDARDRPASGVGVAESGDGSVAEVHAELVRVRADRLDSLLNAVGELIVATGRIAQRERDEDVRRLERVTDEVAVEVRRLRLRPFRDISEALPRAVRDVAAAEGKKVDLQIEGQDVEADRAVMDALREPLLHLVRNAVDHGIETPAEREAAGKPETGTVRVSAALGAGRLVVTVSDDGHGLDAERVRAAARAAGMPVPSSHEEVAASVLRGRISTRDRATAISGRGVGVDLVRTAVERVGGTVALNWNRGQGTTFVIECPPASATLRALLVRIGPHLFAIPTGYIDRLHRVDATSLRRSEGGLVMTTGGQPVPVVSLAALLGPPLEGRAVETTASVVVLNAAERRVAVTVDEALEEAEIVVRPLALEPGTVPAATGAALLPDGRLALVLGAGVLVEQALERGAAAAPVQGDDGGAERLRVLVADDSITTRTLEQSVLESAGYEVLVAVNGEDAWRRLEEQGADAVVADVEMPRMDGIALCRRIRGSSRFQGLPVVLVTGLESEADRVRGLEAGADAYIVKSAFEQQTLLSTLQQLVGR